MRRLYVWFIVGTLFLTNTVSVCRAEEAGEGSPGLFSAFSAGIWTSIVTLVIFILLLVVLGRFAWGPLLSALKSREDRIREDLDSAKRERENAEKLLLQYKEQLAQAQAQAEETIRKSVVEAEKVRDQITTQGEQQARHSVDQARRQIEQAKTQAVKELFAQSAQIAGELAAKILQREVNAEDHRVLIEQGLEELKKKGEARN